VQVSTPGAERVLEVPKDLERFSSFPMYVCYNGHPQDSPTDSNTNSTVVKHEVFELVEIDTDGGAVVWKLADVRINRELMGEGAQAEQEAEGGQDDARPSQTSTSSGYTWTSDVPLIQYCIVHLFVILLPFVRIVNEMCKRGQVLSCLITAMSLYKELTQNCCIVEVKCGLLYCVSCINLCLKAVRCRTQSSRDSLAMVRASTWTPFLISSTDANSSGLWLTPASGHQSPEARYDRLCTQ